MPATPSYAMPAAFIRVSFSLLSPLSLLLAFNDLPPDATRHAVTPLSSR